MCYCDFDPPECSSEVTRKARKTHVCYECGEPIAAGDLYVVHSGIWDGAPDSFKWCGTCQTIHNLASDLHEDGCLCFAYGSLLEAVGEMLRSAGDEEAA